MVWVISHTDTTTCHGRLLPKGFHCRGYNIGIRLIDEFFAKSKTTKCVDFKDTADKVARVSVLYVCLHALPAVPTSMVLLLQVGFRMFLSASAAVSSWNADYTACNVVGFTYYSGGHSYHHQLSAPMGLMLSRCWKTTLW